jgi:uncharacterized protein YodC (DUF2158 family)
MADQVFKIGDVVKLKSGGPDMTIENIGKYGKYGMTATEDSAKCVWFEKTNRKESVFALPLLERAESPQSRSTVAQFRR